MPQTSLPEGHSTLDFEEGLLQRPHPGTSGDTHGDSKQLDRARMEPESFQTAQVQDMDTLQSQCMRRKGHCGRGLQVLTLAAV